MVELVNFCEYYICALGIVIFKMGMLGVVVALYYSISVSLQMKHTLVFGLVWAFTSRVTTYSTPVSHNIKTGQVTSVGSRKNSQGGHSDLCPPSKVQRMEVNHGAEEEGDMT